MTHVRRGAPAGHRRPASPARPGLGQPAGPASTTSRPRPSAATSPRSSGLGLVRRVHGGAVPPSSLSLIESGIRERDQVNTDEKERIARAALDRLPAGRRHDPARRRLARPAGWPAAPPAGPRAHGVTHAVPIAARLAGLPPHRPAAAARPGPADHPGGRRGRHRRGALAELRVDVAFLGTNGITVEPRPDHPRPRRGRGQAGHRRGGPRSWRWPTPPSSASRPPSASPRPATSTSSSPTTAISARRPARPRRGRRSRSSIA